MASEERWWDDDYIQERYNSDPEFAKKWDAALQNNVYVGNSTMTFAEMLQMDKDSQSLLDKFYVKMTEIDSANTSAITSAIKTYSPYIILAGVMFALFYSKNVLGFDIVKFVKRSFKK